MISVVEWGVWGAESFHLNILSPFKLKTEISPMR